MTGRGDVTGQLAERPRAWIGRHHSTDQCCDAAKRMSDVITLHAVAGSAGRFALVKLLDGSQVDLATYSCREEAEGYKTHLAQVAILIPPGGCSASECEEILHYHRELYDLNPRALQVGYLMPLKGPERRKQLLVLSKGANR
jgi:hypothetical protein